tara:strand:+ start:192 stop:758 length:567 start_codon:yes stop_codon:yes gene_type:complete
MWTYNGKRIREGRAWTDDNGVQHPANWHVWSEDEKVAHGLVWVAPQTKPDERFYWFSQNADGTYTSTPKALEDTNEVDDNGDPLLDADGVQVVTKGLKSNWIAQIKQTQGSFLAQTDWAYIRKTDTGVAVPADIQTYRDEVRLAAGTIEDQISNCADLDAFKALFVTPTDADGVPTGNAPIHNWPKEL